MPDFWPRDKRSGFVHVKPPVVTLVVESISDGVVNLSWSATSPAASFALYQGLSPGTENLVAPVGIYDGEVFSAMVTGLTDGTTYYFVVKSLGSLNNGYGPLSNEVSAVPEGAIPLAPAGLTAQPCDTRVKLSWTASAGAVSYNVYESSTSGGETGSPILTGITATTAIVTSLTDGTAAYFKVTAVNDTGESPKSNEATATPFLLLAPVVTPTAGDAKVTLSFTSQAGIAYSAYMGTTPGGETGTPVASGAGTGGTLALVVTGLTDGTQYYFTVKATNPCTQVQTSTEVSAIPVPLTQLSGLAWVLPCLGGGDPCPCAASVNDNTTLTGAPGASFSVTLRIRGVVENQTYSGGTLVGNWYVGGSSTDPDGNTYKLEISDPAQTYYINPTTGAPGTMEVLDFEETITINVGAVVTLTAESGDSAERPNPGNLSAPDDDPTNPIVVVQPFHGQFAQMDAVSITRI